MGTKYSSSGPNISSPVVIAEKDDDRIVLVEQMWKYKRDLSKYLGVRHGFVVTTTLKGEKTKRDIIIGEDGKKHTRVVRYKKSSEDNIWKRIPLSPELTEKDLENKLLSANSTYNVLDNNCWHYSDNVVKSLCGQSDPHPYLRLIANTYSVLSFVLTKQRMTIFNNNTEFS